ncbi:N-acetyltransferase [Okeania sp. SIO2B3]|uniref:GNAT family N-acetyltransferase n=1 Tax=Okeania sp. SIO2B3 TaxID=2607784 RepID=UPI0025F33F3D|nr:GNAT family N-acetyltransferase [Okeania sp. SIO2B3]
MVSKLIPNYQLRRGSGLDRAMLVKFMHWTYQELFPEQNFSHLAKTVDRYLSIQTPIWWVEKMEKPVTSPIGCLWVGNAIDQVEGDRVTHVFLLYVSPPHRRLGIGSALVTHAENWAKARGDRQIGLQVFVSNQPALNLYHKLGFQSESMLMVKSLNEGKGKNIGREN